MICPYCNKEMELGYIDQPRFTPLEWYPANREMAFAVIVSKKRNVRLTYKGTVKAFRCKDCKKIIIDESTLNT